MGEQLENRALDEITRVWGPYPHYGDLARFQYGRMLWRRPAVRARLQAHWLDERHPHHERFQARRELIENVLPSNETVEAIDGRLRLLGTSLRCVAREIPPVFGSFY